MFAPVTPKANFQRKEGTVALSYTIDEGQEVFFGKYIIKRNVRSRSSVIQDCLAFSEGEPFSYQKIIDSTNKLNELGIFHTVRVKPVNLESREKDIDVLVEVEEMKTGRVNFGIGFNSVQGYRGYLEFREDNFDGTALGVSLRGEYSGIGEEYDLSHEVHSRQKVTLGIRDPLLLPQYKIEGDMDLFTIFEEKNGYNLQQTGLKIRLERPLHRTTWLSFTYRLEAAQLHDIQIEVKDIEDRDLTISSIKPLISFDTRDNALDPSRGVFAQLGVEFAGGVMGGESDFSKLTAKVANFFPLSKKLVFAIGVTGGYAWTYRDEEVPIQERFYTGGLNSVRGYKEDSLGPKDEDGVPLGGEELLVGSVELRRDLYRRLKGVLFYDIGSVWSTKDEQTEMNYRTETSMRASAGIGLRLVTPVGPIRLDYGWIVDRRPEESAGKFYLSVGHAF